MQWVFPEHGSEAVDRLAKDAGVPPAIARLLLCRGVHDAVAARNYLQPTLEQMHDPLAMHGMAAAVDRIRGALIAGEPMLIYGDYDVDGTVATVLLKTAVERAGAALGVTADVHYHIPHRIREGYGIQEARIAAAAAEGVRLVISVDTGIRAFAAAREAARHGLQMIVTDHHLPDNAAGLPEALAVLNPNQPGCPYPYKELCGAAVAYKLAQALLESCAPDDAGKRSLRAKTLPSFLKLLAIATIADAVPLTGENRVIAALGLAALRRPAQAGLRVLMELAGIDSDLPVSASDVGFRLAPRINAAGRMDVASDVVDMFLTRDAALARTLAEKLHRLNDERRAVEAEAVSALEARIAHMQEAGEALPGCLVFDDLTHGATQNSVQGTSDAAKGWHRGVIGILASRVVDRTGTPALVLAHEEGQAYGSGRSVAGFHLLDALTAVHSAEAEGLFARFGGHAHAVGFSLPSDRVALLRLRMAEEAARVLAGEPRTPEMECDAALRLDEITPDFLAWMERLGPFGNGNREPLFVARNLRLAADPKAVKDRHLRLLLEDADTGAQRGGMAWGRRTDWAAQARAWGLVQGSLVDAAFRLRLNRHPDFGGWELEIVGLQLARGEPAGQPAGKPQG